MHSFWCFLCQHWQLDWRPQSQDSCVRGGLGGAFARLHGGCRGAYSGSLMPELPISKEEAPGSHYEENVFSEAGNLLQTRAGSREQARGLLHISFWCIL